jgi:lipoprotein signal peptidase
MEAKRLRACWLYTLSVVAVDQFTKTSAAHVDSGAIVGSRNPDYAFGVMSGSAAALVVGTLAVLGVFLMLIGRWAMQIGVPAIVPALVAGGMLGNVLDRIRLGAVRDFLVTPWAICNLADIAIFAGIVCLGVMFALRLIQLRCAAATIRFVGPGLRAVIVEIEPQHNRSEHDSTEEVSGRAA